MKIKLSNFLIIISLLAISMIVKGQPTINEADNQFYGLDLDGATESYLKIFQDNSADDASRALAGRKLAHIHWHFYNDIEKAREYAVKSLEYKKYEAYIFHDLIKCESKAKNFINAKEAYQQALTKLDSDQKLQMVNIAYADMVLIEAIDKIENNQPLDNKLLNDALQKIEKVNKQEPGNLSPAKIQLGLSLLTKDGEKALQAWRLYYHIADGENAKGLLSIPEKELTNILTGWNKTNLSSEDCQKLILNLAASRFYRLADLMNKYLSNNSGFEDPLIIEICDYYDFCVKIEERLYKYYKDLAVKNENYISELKKDIDIIQEDLWDKLHWHGKELKYTQKNFRKEIYKRFGTKIFEKKLNGRYFYIGGHNIIEANRVVEQFGKKADIQFAVLDHRFSNNYWGWFTGYMGFAGYADESEIVKYREPEASNPIYVWKKLTNKELLNNWQKEISKQSIMDDSLALNSPYTNLPGIYNRIQLRIYSEILDSLKECGIKEDNLRMHFISELNEMGYNRNINHEGRHAIDFNYLPKMKLNDDTELEYRAMLSEIYFSKFPLFQIRFDCDNTPHGLARKKRLQDIINWMEHNKEKIDGFDESRPTITQIDLLSDHQIRIIIESVESFLN